jgi:hypothetical protein
MWHEVEFKLDVQVNVQPENLQPENMQVYYGGVQERQLTWEEWSTGGKPTLPKVLKIDPDLQEGSRLLQLQKCKNGGLATVASHGPQLGNGGLVGGLATVASHGPQLRNGGLVGGLVGGLATKASHGLQLANGGRKAGNTVNQGKNYSAGHCRISLCIRCR